MKRLWWAEVIGEKRAWKVLLQQAQMHVQHPGGEQAIVMQPCSGGWRPLAVTSASNGLWPHVPCCFRLRQSLASLACDQTHAWKIGNTEQDFSWCWVTICGLFSAALRAHSRAIICVSTALPGSGSQAPRVWLHQRRWAARENVPPRGSEGTAVQQIRGKKK